MIPSVALAALAASVAMHVSWNLMVRRADPSAACSLYLLGESRAGV
ncbi:MAG TPA: hypothetical protein VGA88_02325 [Burkholderiales bacterium]